VTARRTVSFLGAVVTAGRRGPGGGDSRADGTVPRRDGDDDDGGGGQGGGGIVPDAAVKAEEERDGDDNEGRGGEGRLSSQARW
jgi:hypothetical protein